MRIRLKKLAYELVCAKLPPTIYGDCDPPDVSHRKIRVNKRIRSSKTLMTTLVHEMIHACLWDLSEESVDRISKDIAEVLHKLGARIEKPP